MKRWAPLVALLVVATGASAHDFSFTDVLIVLASDGTFHADVRIDVDALALGASHDADPAVLAAELEALSASHFEEALERARDALRRDVLVRFDGVAADVAVSFPALDLPAPPVDAPPSVLGMTARLQGRIPTGAHALALVGSPGLGLVRLTIVEQTSARIAQHTLASGEESPAFTLGGEAELAAGAPSAAATLGRFVVLGFEHIVPRGVDHMLFVLGLFLLSARWKPLLWQISAFTLAHTLTLGLSVYGIVALPARVVEPLIAASIAWIAIENLFTSKLKPWRPAVVFAFGLLHGLGFASVLVELGLPEGRTVPALAGFNIGVELGQLAVVGAAWLVVGRFRGKSWYRSAVVLPASATIAAVGVLWAIERAF